jgi:hypothetical protein
MWAEIEKGLAASETGVLNATDPDGYPYSARYRLLPDPQAAVLRLDLDGGGAVRPGPASLLCHNHDEELWNQKVFLLLGRLEGSGHELVFRPERTVGGMGTRAAARMLIGARKATSAYLKKRGLERPRIPWDEVEEVQRI